MKDKFEYAHLTKEEAIQLLDQAVKDKNIAFIHPQLASRLMELGVDIKVKEGETVSEFFDRTQPHAEILSNQLPPMPSWLEFQFQRPYFEARWCLLLGLHGASITLSAILLERVIKWTTFCLENAANTTSDGKERWEEIEEKMQFGDAVGYAKRWGLVDKNLSKKLDLFRDKIRNVQGHQLTHRATRGVTIEQTSIIDFSSKTLAENQVISAHDSPAVAAIAKEKMDEANAQDVFMFVHSCIEHLFTKRDEILTKPKQPVAG